jgi:hypothetical protein
MRLPVATLLRYLPHRAGPTSQPPQPILARRFTRGGACSHWSSWEHWTKWSTFAEDTCLPCRGVDAASVIRPHRPTAELAQSLGRRAQR